jgi:hypothetical protein
VRTDLGLYWRFEGYDELKPLLDGPEENLLVELRKPALVHIPGTDTKPRARLVTGLLHGNEDAGFHALVSVLREGARYPFDLYLFFGNVRAAFESGWFAHRYLEGQEDFNRVWGLLPPTTRMRRCAAEVLAELTSLDLEGVVDIHNNTGDNPYYAIVPDPTPEAVHLASTLSDTILRWPLKAYTLMEALSPYCPAVSVECGLPGVPANNAFAVDVVRRFLAMDAIDGPADQHSQPRRLFEMRHRIEVRPEVPFAFGGQLTDDVEFVLHPGLDGHNFGMLLAGTELGRVHGGASMPLLCTDMRGRETTDEFFRIDAAGRLRVVQDVTPVMFVTTVEQTRRDCLFYIARRRI